MILIECLRLIQEGGLPQTLGQLSILVQQTSVLYDTGIWKPQGGPEAVFSQGAEMDPGRQEPKRIRAAAVRKFSPPKTCSS